MRNACFDERSPSDRGDEKAARAWDVGCAVLGPGTDSGKDMADREEDLH